jgi:hypothetical protein
MNEYSEKQKNKIKENFLEALSKGVTIRQACKSVGVDESTIWRWRNCPKYKDDNFSNEVLNVLDSRIQSVEDALFVNATGYEVVDKDGNKKTIRGDTTAQIFFLKNRSKGRWKDKQEIEHSGKLELNKEETNELIDLAERAIEQLKSNDKGSEKGN